MGRWEPNTRGRLEQAALELYIERGFEQTTVAEIAERAGLTERTFFRHFADKREVLFGDAGAWHERVVNAVVGAPPSAAPMEAVAAGLQAAGAIFQENVERSRRRQSVIDANAELQARELSKLAALASAIRDALHRRGVAAPTAGLAAEAGIVVFRVAFERWINQTRPQDWSPLVRESLGELQAVVASEEVR
ncbi:TetR family transcriptional regulator [Deinococcus aetherius]|uniref:TetR family transcriptional regulator n=1 Tax=Deinococcus aetherius TaxID=200252 RepID=A0ABM8AD02_9DEIO|nr:TetR/AcrR family transcriptional regulator [Deinococcus aetherius]BDP41656.1 TetR family transcriptional regulator [Deinococcus aetherius]